MCSYVSKEKEDSVDRHAFRHTQRGKAVSSLCQSIVRVFGLEKGEKFKFTRNRYCPLYDVWFQNFLSTSFSETHQSIIILFYTLIDNYYFFLKKFDLISRVNQRKREY